MARPREFDRERALQTAMRLFWQRGFEGVSVAELMTAMNIAPPSFYAAFGSKAALYREALSAYQHRPRAVSICPLEGEMPMRDAVRELLLMAISTVTEMSPSCGCMIANGLLAVGPEHTDLAELTAELRRGLIAALDARLEVAVNNGELAAGTCHATLSRYFAAIVQGISVQAHDGASEQQLAKLVQFALEVLPTPPKPATKKRTPHIFSAKTKPVALRERRQRSITAKR